MACFAASHLWSRKDVQSAKGRVQFMAFHQAAHEKVPRHLQRGCGNPKNKGVNPDETSVSCSAELISLDPRHGLNDEMMSEITRNGLFSGSMFMYQRLHVAFLAQDASFWFSDL